MLLTRPVEVTEFRLEQPLTFDVTVRLGYRWVDKRAERYVSELTRTSQVITDTLRVIHSAGLSTVLAVEGAREGKKPTGKMFVLLEDVSRPADVAVLMAAGRVHVPAEAVAVQDEAQSAAEESEL